MKAKLSVKKGDTVIMISGDQKGTQGTVLEAFPRTGRIVVEGVALRKKHQKPRREGQAGQIIDKQHAVAASKVRKVDAKPAKVSKKKA